MTSKEELQTKILYLEKELEDLADCHSSKMKEIEAKIDNIKEQIEDDEEPSGLWKPKAGELYYYINDHRKIFIYYVQTGKISSNYRSTKNDKRKEIYS